MRIMIYLLIHSFLALAVYIYADRNSQELSSSVGFFGSDSQDRALLMFAGGSFLISILCPIVFGTLSKKAVDFWYYTLAIVGVVLLFLEGRSDRLQAMQPTFEYRMELQQERREKRISFLSSLPDDLNFEDLVADAATSRLAEIANIKTICGSLDQADIKLQFFERMNRNLQNVTICRDVDNVEMYKMLSQEPLSIPAAEVPHSGDHQMASELHSLYWPVDSGFSLLQMLRMFNVQMPKEVVSSLIEEAEADLEKIAQARRAFASELQSSYPRHVPFGWRVFQNKIFSFSIWPFLLVFCLSMKLARENLLKGIIKRK